MNKIVPGVKAMIPKVALIWINYNSSHIISVVKASLKSLFEINYPNSKYEIIIVDNASKDNSWKVVREMSKKYSRKYNVRTIFYRSSRNFLYTGGNEIGLRLMGKDVDYVVFINNDVIVNPDSLFKLIEYLSTYKRVGAVQGVLYYDIKKLYVNCAGCFIDTLFNCHMVSTHINKPISVSYAFGAYSVYSINAIKKCLHDNRLFFQCAPAFFDDNYLGIRLWNLGFLVCTLPIDAGIHLHSATFRKLSLLKEINIVKSLVVKVNALVQEYPMLHNLYVIKELLKSLRKLSLSTLLKVYREARICGNFVVRSLNNRLNIRFMPHIPLSLSEIIKIILGAGRSVYAKFLDGNYLLSRACLSNLCPE